ncbi:MAG: MerR family transcriptional regulator [Peptococcaceae bacterium]|nr:MerR family transcriptional regulator [Peptococcaceae bacterium]
MLQIGEFSKTCQVSVKTLHHYDKIGLLKPARVDAETGYRYYTAAQIDTMNMIGRLKRYGFSLDEIQQFLAQDNTQQRLNALRQRKQQLKGEAQTLHTILSELQTHISIFERTGDIMSYQKNYHITLGQSPQIGALAHRAVMAVDDFGKYYHSLYERVPAERVTPTGIVGARYFDEEFNHDATDIEVFIGIREPDKADTLIAPTDCAMTTHHGAYSTLSEAYGALVSWILANGYQIAGAPFELYTKTQFDALAPEDWETDIYFPVKK